MNDASIRKTSAEWASSNPVLELDILGVDTDKNLFKIGDGEKKWADLDVDPRSPGQYTKCRPLLIGGVPANPGDPAPDQVIPPETEIPLVVNQKRIVLNGAADPRSVGDLDASFGGMVLKGFRDHFWLYDYANNAWNTSDNINLSCETGLMIDNRKALDERQIRVGNRTRGGKIYLGSGEHDSWRIGTDDDGNLAIEYRRLDGQWVVQKKIHLSDEDRGLHLSEEHENPYQEQSNEPAKRPLTFNPNKNSKNHGKMAWPLHESCDKVLSMKLFLNTDDAFALGRIMKRTANFNGVIPGPMLKVQPGDTIEIDFYNELEDLSELETWSDGIMQRNEMVHMHLDDRAYTADKDTPDEKDDDRRAYDEVLRTKTIWMQHIMARGLTNLHTHGFHVRPNGFGDNVMRSAKPGSRLRYRYKLPENHFGGLQWFHPHGHGGSMNLVSRGAIGTILVEGPYQQRLNTSKVAREYIILQRIQWGNNLNGHDELNWVDYVANLDPDMLTPLTASPEAQQGIDLSPYYRDNLDPKCICSCAALEGAPHAHGTFSLATPQCEAVDVRWVPAVNGQKRPYFKTQIGELKVFSMLNATGITFFRIEIEDHDIVVVGRDGIPQISQTPLFNDMGVDPDFVRTPGGQRLNYVICNSGQRFEFFIIPKKGIVPQQRAYSILSCPISETEEFPSDDPTIQIATLRYEGELPESAPNHLIQLPSLLPNPHDDNKPGTPKSDLPVDRSQLCYLYKDELDHRKDGKNLDELLDGKTTATVYGATVTLNENMATCNEDTATVVMPPRYKLTDITLDWLSQTLDEHGNKLIPPTMLTKLRNLKDREYDNRILLAETLSPEELTIFNHLSASYLIPPSHFMLTKERIQALVSHSLPKAVADQLAPLLNKAFDTQAEFLAQLSLSLKDRSDPEHPSDDNYHQFRQQILIAAAIPADNPHHLEVCMEIQINGTPYIIKAVDENDIATFTIGLPHNSTDKLPESGVYDFQYRLYKTKTINNKSTKDHCREIYEVLTDHFYYRQLPFKPENFKNYIIRQREMSFAIHKSGLGGQGADSTLMNKSAFNDFNRTVGYLDTNEEFKISLTLSTSSIFTSTTSR